MALSITRLNWRSRLKEGALASGSILENRGEESGIQAIASLKLEPFNILLLLGNLTRVCPNT
ncbi:MULTISPECIES: hypothetical protein [Nostocales]|uniref:hypothetical protein n=1 Tax=Nostocales TaxID=1161 RepID=UPI001F5494D6|nr:MULTISPECIES: hypothetical protein [Nostocales]